MNLIERYVYDVVRRLPEKDREEVRKELKSNIYDMLSEEADENEIKSVLYGLGSPSILAEKYRQNPRYLISPAIYDDYIRILKWLVPLIGVVLMAIGMIWGAIDAISGNEMVDISEVINNIFTKGFSLGFTAAFQALVWTTVGFVIAERTGGITQKSQEREWEIEDLPEVLLNKGRIPLSDIITELILTIVFSVIAILLCSGKLPIAFMIDNGDIQVHQFFSSGFLAGCIPAIVSIMVFSICESIVKIKNRLWTPVVCGTVIVTNLVNMGIMLYLVNRPNILSEEFMTFVKSGDWSSDLLRIMGNGIAYPILIISIIIVICSLATCGTALYKTIKTGATEE